MGYSPWGCKELDPTEQLILRVQVGVGTSRAGNCLPSPILGHQCRGDQLLLGSEKVL